MGFSGPVEDRLMIREAFDTYADAVIWRDAESWGALWSKDAMWSMPDYPEFVGSRAKAVETWKAAMALYPGIIFIANSGAITVNGDTAAARSTSEVFTAADGKVHRHRGTYEDAVVKKDGKWLFFMRSFHNIHRAES